MANLNQKYGNTKTAALIKSIVFIIFFLVLVMACATIGSAFPQPYNRLFYGLSGMAIGYLTIWLAMRVEGQPLSSIGMQWNKQTLLRFLLGMSIATFIFISMMAVLLSITPLYLTYNRSFFTLSNFFIYLPIFPLAFAEELCFRSYPQIKLSDVFGPWVSQFVIAVLFGAYHVLMGWSVYAAFTGPFVWAFVFGLAAIKYGGIAVPTGIHFTINILQSLVGFKRNSTALWVSNYPPGTSKAMMDRANQIGLQMHVVLLISALILTALYAKNRQRQTTSL